MLDHADKLEFEQASHVRDSLEDLRHYLYHEANETPNKL